jgi:hypothetical protein
MISSENLRPAGNGRKPLGKLASRLEEVKNPWRQVATLELSHNEAARLATDALLEQGEKEYRRVLTEERELNFLSPLEIRYITEHATKACDDSNGTAGCNERDFGDGDALSSRPFRNAGRAGRQLSLCGTPEKSSYRQMSLSERSSIRVEEIVPAARVAIQVLITH